LERVEEYNISEYTSDIYAGLQVGFQILKKNVKEKQQTNKKVQKPKIGTKKFNFFLVVKKSQA
jgi:hypothetical protein